jgi:integrase
MLRARMASNDSQWVLPGGRKAADDALLSTSLDAQHGTARTALGLPKDFVLHSLRHTFLTRLGDAGVDAFTIMRIAGHSTIAISQKYIHPSTEAMERASDRLETFNARVEPEQLDKPETVAKKQPTRYSIRYTAGTGLRQRDVSY